MISDGLRSAFPGVFTDISLDRFTTWNVGGPCTAAFVGSRNELETVMRIIRDQELSWTILGRGSNTLAPSKGWDGIAVILKGEFTRYRFSGDNMLTAGAGAPLPSMAGAACSRGLAGLGFAVGIPGTLGGALFMNAGAYGSSTGDVVKEVTVLTDEDEYKTLSRDECGFQYRSSIFQTCRCIVTGVLMDLTVFSGSAAELKAEARNTLRLRREKFPLTMPNAGSVFKRPVNGPPPGKLIEDCGLKGFSVRAARVSPVHANFIENTGGATSDDILKLMEMIQSKVEADTGIRLAREIRIIGEFR